MAAFPPSLKKIIGPAPLLSQTLSDYPLGPGLVLRDARRADLRKCRNSGTVPELSRTNLLQRLENRLANNADTVGAVFSEDQLVGLWIPQSNVRPQYMRQAGATAFGSPEDIIAAVNEPSTTIPREVVEGNIDTFAEWINER